MICLIPQKNKFKLFILQQNNIDEAMKACGEVLQLDPSNIDAMVDNAEVLLANEDYEGGQ